MTNETKVLTLETGGVYFYSDDTNAVTFEVLSDVGTNREWREIVIIHAVQQTIYYKYQIGEVLTWRAAGWTGCIRLK